MKGRGVILGLILLCGLGLRLPAQQDWSWAFGDSVVMLFPGGGGPLVDANARSRYSLESSSCVSDGAGNLKYYAMDWIRRADGSIPPGGNPLAGEYLTNAYQILPVWGDTSSNLVFSLSYNCGLPFLCPWLSEIWSPPGHDTLLNVHNIGEYHPTNSLVEKVSAVRDAGGTGWWVVMHGHNDDVFVKFKVDGRQVAPLTTQSIGSVHGVVGANAYAPLGEMCFSEQGDRLLAVTWTGIVDVFDFDRCTGQLSNWIALGAAAPIDTAANTYYGCSFSPDGSKIYVSEGGNGYAGGNRLYQFDLNAPNIPASKTLIFTYPDSVEGGQHQLGPDGKIYLSQAFNVLFPDNPNNYHLAVINNPNAAGLACNFVYQQVYLEGLHSTGGLPNLPNFNLPPLVAQVAEAGPPQIYICPGDSVQIGYPDSTGGAVTYSWSGPFINATDTAKAQAWVHPVADTWYYLTAIDTAMGLPCGRTVDSIHVLIADSVMFPTVSLPADTTICPGDTISITANVNAGDWDYLWQPSGVTTPTVAVSGAGTWQVTVSNPAVIAYIGGGACFSATDAITLDTFAVLPNPEPTDTTICRGDSLPLGMPLPPEWAAIWTPTAGLLHPDSGQTVAWPTFSATYTLYATDTTNPGGCATVRDTARIKVEQPFTHEAPESQEFCPGEVLAVGVESVSGFSYAWSPVAGLQNPYVSATAVAPTVPIVYTLAVTSDTMVSENCRTQYFPVTLASDGCLLQNVVTPNGDGVNDYLNLGTFNGHVTLAIYDRWGGLVYSSNGYQNNWPAQDSKLPETVYYYVLKVGTEGGKAHSGQVMIVR
ncbi:MAG: gliding motility-associated C-terminal domain-containing protein [Bacteroidia bacterium]